MPRRPSIADDPDAPVFVGDGVSVTRANGCFRDLSWNLELAQHDWDRLRAGLRGAGWAEASRIEGLYDYMAPEAGHRLVVVPGSDWVQLRLSYLVPAERRCATMETLAQAVADLVTSRTTPPPASRSGRRSRRPRRTSSSRP